MVRYNPSEENSRSLPRIEVVSIFALELAKWTVSAAILLEFFGIIHVVRFLESAGGSLCHHQATRCFGGIDGSWVVCARCSGMYFGWMVPLLLVPIFQSRLVHSRYLGIVAGLFVFAVVSALLERYGVLTTNNSIRAILGMPLGIFPSVMILFVTTRLKEATPSTLPHP